MKLAYVQHTTVATDWIEALSAAVDLGLPNLFNFEWLIDQAERGEWGGIWW